MKRALQLKRMRSEVENVLEGLGMKKMQSLKDEKKTDQDVNMQPTENSYKKRENTTK